MKSILCSILITLTIAGYATAEAASKENTTESKYTVEGSASVMPEEKANQKQLLTASSDKHVMEIYSVSETKANTVTSQKKNSGRKPLLTASSDKHVMEIYSVSESQANTVAGSSHHKK